MEPGPAAVSALNEARAYSWKPHDTPSPFPVSEPHLR